ncbi:MAG: hypothetical protein AB7S65_09440 [Sulfuricurvum sp.]
MIKWFSVPLIVAMISGCAPKMGQDIRIEPASGIRLENSSGEMMLGVLWLLGAPVEKEAIRLGGDVRVINRWHSDMRLVSLSYALEDSKDVIAQGESKNSVEGAWVIPSGSDKTIPLTLRVDMEKLTPQRIEGVLRSKRKLVLKGDAVIDVWGWQHHYVFETDATKEISKVLRKI